MHEPPSGLFDAIPAEGRPIALAWWESLDDEERGRLSSLWDERLEVRFFAPQADDAGGVDPWERVPRVIGGKFVPHDDAWGLDEWGPGYFEHLLEHPELVIVWEPQMRTFHIGCTLHDAARACLESGGVPIDFRCPVGSTACPLLPLRGGRLARRRPGR